MVSYDEFKEIFLKMPNNSEYEVYLADTTTTYSIVKYSDSVSFARCGYSEKMIKEWDIKTDFVGTDEMIYTSLDELVNANLVDGVRLLDDWNKITDIVINNSFSVNRDLEELAEIYFKEK